MEPICTLTDEETVMHLACRLGSFCKRLAGADLTWTLRLAAVAPLESVQFGRLFNYDCTHLVGRRRRSHQRIGGSLNSTWQSLSLPEARRGSRRIVKPVWLHYHIGKSHSALSWQLAMACTEDLATTSCTPSTGPSIVVGIGVAVVAGSERGSVLGVLCAVRVAAWVQGRRHSPVS